MKKYILLITVLVFVILPGCSGETKSDLEASEKGILSKDDAEVLIYDTLSKDEKEKYTVDYVKEEGTNYYIRVYEGTEGDIKVKAKYKVDYKTKEIKKINVK
ncbi:hypothetical protein [Pseudalkalibacillus sp. JSM 102089]|uniref:hypothetical protein n=1 Tax=Pseudalkalibacillus sp. JSM 102089 TaxID=3229856 RepID=UPI0035256FAB